MNLYGLLSKMSNPLESSKIEALEKALVYLNEISKPVNDNEINSFHDQVNQLVNVIKCRLVENNPTISLGYLEVVKLMLAKGLLNKVRIRCLLPVLLKRLNSPDSGKQVYKFIEDCISWNPSFVFPFIANELNNEEVTEALLTLLNIHNEILINHAELKGFIVPLLQNISANVFRKNCELLLNQIIEMTSIAQLEKIAKERVLPNIEDYLAKWNIVIQAKPSLKHFNSSEQVVVLNKNDRLRA